MDRYVIGQLLFFLFFVLVVIGLYACCIRRTTEYKERVARKIVSASILWSYIVLMLLGMLEVSRLFL